jgi:hypothetical protein
MVLKPILCALATFTFTHLHRSMTPFEKIVTKAKGSQLSFFLTSSDMFRIRLHNLRKKIERNMILLRICK